MKAGALKSILLHGVVAFITGFGVLLSGFVAAHPDPTTWTLKSFIMALGVMAIAVMKKIIAGELLGTQ